MTLAVTKKRFTPLEYYTLEDAALYKSDFYDGEIFAMSGGTPRHSLAIANITGEVRERLKGKPCRAYDSNLRIKSKLTGLRTYPDVSVFCEPLELDEEDPSRGTAPNPSVLFEVLSRSTEGYDRGLKAESYRGITSLKAYVLISQKKAHVEIYERQADRSWKLREESGLNASLNISAIGIDLPLSEIYADVDFTQPGEIPGPISPPPSER